MATNIRSQVAYLRSYTVRELVEKKRERTLLWLATKLPKRLKYWVVIAVAAETSWNDPCKEVPTITWADMAKGLERKRNDQKN